MYNTHFQNETTLQGTDKIGADSCSRYPIPLGAERDWCCTCFVFSPVGPRLLRTLQFVLIQLPVSFVPNLILMTAGPSSMFQSAG
jgi:hypothetical protein